MGLSVEAVSSIVLPFSSYHLCLAHISLVLTRLSLFTCLFLLLDDKMLEGRGLGLFTVMLPTLPSVWCIVDKK